MGVNVVMCMILSFVVQYERHHTKNDETMSQFLRITFLQYINIAVIVLLVNMDLYPTDQLFLGFLPILNGEYADLDAQWYSNVGTTISFSLLLGVFTPHASYFFFAGLNLFMRCLDRGCKSDLKIEDEQEIKENYDVDVRTKTLH